MIYRGTVRLVNLILIMDDKENIFTEGSSDGNENSRPEHDVPEKNHHLLVEIAALEEGVNHDPRNHDQRGPNDDDPGDYSPAALQLVSLGM